MLDEPLSGFATRPSDRGIDIDGEHALHVHAQDVEEHWQLAINREGIETSCGGTEAELTATATATELYLLMWNRTEDSTVTLTGEAELIDVWREACRVRWSGGG